MSAEAVTPVQRCLNGLRDGDPAARNDLLAVSQERLRLLTRKMSHGFPGVQRWVETDDVLQNVLIRLDRALPELALESTRDFLRLAATQIRRELIDLARHYFGPEGPGANHATPAGDRAGRPLDVAAPDSTGNSPIDWERVHELVAAFPENIREVFDLLWYHDLTQQEAAALLGVSVRTVKMRWQTARLRLAEELGLEISV